MAPWPSWIPTSGSSPPRARPATRTAFRTCPLCEAGCGLEVTVARDDDGVERVTRIRGDRDDVFSHGFICPKGSTLRQLHDDPDRLRQPVVKRDGVFVEVGWDEAFAEVERLLGGVIEAHGREALGAYVGNPNAHNLGALLFLKPVLRALGTTNLFSASTVDQRPKEISSGLMFGAPLTVPVPDLDRTDHLLLLGANPVESNGSLATAPDWPGRLKAIRERGGRLVVVDPRRTKTAALADEWVAIRPGTDALLLAALVATLVEEGLVDPGAAGPHLAGVDEACAAVAPFTAEAVAAATGIAADDDPPPRPRPGRRAHRRGLRPHRHHDRRVRHHRLLAGRRAQRPHRQPRPPRRGHVHPPGGRLAHHAGRARHRSGPPARQAAQPGAGPGRVAGRAARLGPRRGDRHAGRAEASLSNIPSHSR